MELTSFACPIKNKLSMPRELPQIPFSKIT